MKAAEEEQEQEQELEQQKQKEIDFQRQKVEQEKEYLNRLQKLAEREKILLKRETILNEREIEFNKLLNNYNINQQLSNKSNHKIDKMSKPTQETQLNKGEKNIKNNTNTDTTITSKSSEKIESSANSITANHPKLNYLEAKDGTRVIHDDPWLEPCKQALIDRYSRYQYKKKEIEKNEGGLDEFSQGYKKFGFNQVKGGISFKEWAPNAKQMFLMGEFNNWDRNSHELKKDDFGCFNIFLPDINGQPAIQHKTKVKLSLITMSGERIERIPAWIKVVWQEKGNIHFDGVYWNPPKSNENPFEWKNKSPIPPSDLRIYEAHVGMSSPDPKISTYHEFTRDVLPYVASLGYNAVQIMAIMEHAYYASFGYQVTNFFAISSRFGTPEELKYLVDKAHELGLVVLLDLVHSHASKNVDDGLNRFDGTDHQYFHEGAKGNHPIWDSRLFNYGSWEVLRFLLSNARWFVEEYHFDGFRFDGVTSMIYTHHGVAHSFDNGYDEYFNSSLVENDAVTYLTLVNDLLHNLPSRRDTNSQIITIAEEVSGFATMCRPIEEGGIGFDYRLAMGIPDKWIELLKEGVPDEKWEMGNIVYSLTNRRHLEKNISYCESHDQALVGDKTIAFWLMDKEMYTNMSVLQPMSQVTDRGMQLHKMIRLITYALGGEGYLNFMGNEFGHPEWIDFPREGNNDSYHYARRRFDLSRDPLLRYQNLLNFDRAMHALEIIYHWLSSPQAYITLKHDGDKVIAFERGNLFWVFNFHHSSSFTDYAIGISHPGKYKIVLNSDESDFGGHNRITQHTDYFTEPTEQHGKQHRIKLYLPSRSALVFALDAKSK